MKEVTKPYDMRFDAEFERRLFRLLGEIEGYQYEGRCGNVLPALFSCVSYVWGNDPYVTKLKKRSH